MLDIAFSVQEINSEDNDHTGVRWVVLGRKETEGI